MGRNNQRQNKRNCSTLERIGAAFVFSLIFSVVLSGCATVTEKLNAVEPADIATFTVKKDKAGELRGQLSSPLLPGATFHGDVTVKENIYIFYITTVRFFANWPNGWTEGIYEASGTYTFERQEANRQEGYLLTVEDPFTLWNIKSGALRYFDTYFRGDDGLSRVKNRIDRIEETTRFLKDEMKRRIWYSSKEYSERIAPLLFPEAKRKFARQNGLFQSCREECCKEMVPGAGIRWCTGYSEKLLPENLIPLRNSGTMWRDWEEAGKLWYTISNLEYVLHTLFDKARLREGG
jgi:hypothetical protein